MLLTIKVDESSAAKLHQIICTSHVSDEAGGRSQSSERPEASRSDQLDQPLALMTLLILPHHQVSVRLSSNTASYSLVTPASTIHCRNEYLILPTQYHYSSKTSNSSVGDWSESLASDRLNSSDLNFSFHFPNEVACIWPPLWSFADWSLAIPPAVLATQPCCTPNPQPPAPLNQQHRSD